MINSGELKEPRFGLFKELLKLCDLNRHVNQYK